MRTLKPITPKEETQVEGYPLGFDAMVSISLPVSIWDPGCCPEAAQIKLADKGASEHGGAAII